MARRVMRFSPKSSIAAVVVFVSIIQINYGSDRTINLNQCKPDNICEHFRCSLPEKDCSQGVIRNNASICGCCPVCVTLLVEGDNCLNVRRPLKGLPHKECKSGLRCSETTGRCEKIPVINQLSPCLRLRSLRQSLFEEFQKANTPVKLSDHVLGPESYPQCEPNGFFKARQCNSHKCFCVADYGQRIDGQMPKRTATNMTCGCSRTLFAKRQRDRSKWLTAPEMHCTPYGDFEELQCMGNSCFCADQSTGRQTNSVVSLNMIKTLPCIGDKKSYLSRCEVEAIRERGKIYDCERKGITPEVLMAVRCDNTGMFAKKQCDRSNCTCTSDTGRFLKDEKLIYYVPKNVNTTDDYYMSCSCARDEYDRENKHLHYNLVECNTFGGAKPLQKFQTQFVTDCYCVDEDGDRITEVQSCNIVTETICSMLAKELKTREKFVIENENKL